ncbi:hypothetical protein [Cognatishimia maritima]|uniref:Uncharacterized protein n=1 Tax=Cognatishimia maritima TaxID=870908 RepID=A0A1M5V0R9_9RHOB|nr:hypothetical protein [Cognatishimia maritima]SHH68776.1 hypothetical protein SAMN04488044_3031 [Cognatishimia maritima]
MPRLIRMYIVNVMIGFLLSAAFVGILLALDIAGLRGLIFGSAAGWIAVLMLWVFNGIVFAGVQFSIRIMLMASKDGSGGGKRQPASRATRLAPVVVPVKR